MFFWFLGLSGGLVARVFRSPALDYRLVMLGSVLPLGEVVLGGPRLLHTLVFSVALLTVVMLATRRRRLVRRRWIGVPIGVMVHLLLDGVWTVTNVFWWPFFGLAFGDGRLPELDRPLVLIVVLEALGVASLLWSWREFGLDDSRHRKTFLRTGNLPRESMAP